MYVQCLLTVARINNALPLPSVLKGALKIVEGPASSAAGNPDEVAKLFPGLYGQPSVSVVPDQSGASLGEKLKIGVVLSGGQAPGGHNVISGLFGKGFNECAKGSTFYGLKGGPAGIMKCKYVELNAEYIQPYRNQGGRDMICSGRDKIETPEQFKQTEETAKKLDLDGLVTQMRYHSRRGMICKAMVQEVTQGIPSVYAREMERLSTKESLILAHSRRIFNDVNERITILERLNPTPRPTTSPYLEGRWSFEWFGSNTLGSLAARVISERFLSSFVSLSSMDIVIKYASTRVTANVKLLNMVENKVILTSK
ncbi:unnamed protein product [Eruca vesicaria subsp. sativa]|uniref:Uncharacterized protein n=1 Tax=Eruca vesicaria subsp. sativa TaxID=29727 RepID=A0ABC8K2T8_ERUVS|nr:unnamed protein product [Eruca vesicaria subsp. sativa]